MSETDFYGEYLRKSDHRQLYQLPNRSLRANKTMKYPVVVVLAILFIAEVVVGYPAHNLDDYRYIDRDYASPGAHQLASWIASQLRAPKDYIPTPEVPILPYRLPLQGKRNSEVSNAIIGSEETQKMYRDGRK